MWSDEPENEEKEKLIKKPAAQTAAQKIVAKAKKTQKIKTLEKEKITTGSPVPLISSTPKMPKAKLVKSPSKLDVKVVDLVEPVAKKLIEEDILPTDIDKVKLDKGCILAWHLTFFLGAPWKMRKFTKNCRITKRSNFAEIFQFGY